MLVQKWEDTNCLHSNVVSNLYSRELNQPTKVQAEVFTHYKNFCDFLIASQTGSGKTLAFASPIISDLLFFQEKASLPNEILVLILTPTRQLAQQIYNMIDLVLQNTPIRQLMIVGGLSAQKQLRVLSKKKPHILIATPGRLHQFLEEQHLNFEYLKYLVIDQADRMIEMGHYVELDKILHQIFNPKLEEVYQKDFHQINESLKTQNQSNNQFYIKKNGKKVGLNFNMNNFQTGKLFEVPMEMISIYDQNEEKKPKISKKKKQLNQIPQENEIEEEVQEVQHNMSDERSYELWEKVKRKIFFISATLTRQFKGTKYFMKKKDKKKNEKKDEKKTQEEGSDYTPKLKALLSRVNFNTKPKIIDQSSEYFLPNKLKECYSFTTDELEKISFLLCYLHELQQDHKTIVFANTIKAAKRIQFFISQAGYKSVILHSHMLQKQRLMKLQKFKNAKNHILISTDIAARGLDFFITNVIQFGVPVNGDTYVHRAGRTARANRAGQALILISEKEANRWEEISSIVSGSSSRTIHKYSPQQLLMNDIKEKVQRYEWIRINEQRLQNKRIQNLNDQEAEMLGVEVQEDKNQKKLDREQEQLHQREIKKKVKKLKEVDRVENKKIVEVGDGKVWKKNKLVMTIDEIKKFL